MDGGMLSQDEINALLNGMDLSDSAPAEAPAAASSAKKKEPIDEALLSPDERDAVGEIANISLGSSATTLYALVNRKVNITTPVVTLAQWHDITDEYERPCVFIQIKYTTGLDGTNIMVLKENDVKMITDLMMGGDGTNTDGELGELHLSAISEAMNQMMGAAATSLSTMLNRMIDISPPESTLVETAAFKDASEIAEFLEGTFVKIAFRLQIGDLVDSTMMQLYPIEFSKTLFATFMQNQGMTSLSSESAPEPAPAPVPQPQPQPQPQPSQPMNEPAYNQPMGMGQMGMNQMGMGQMGMPQMNMNQMGMGQMGMPQMNMNQMYMPDMNIQPAQFQNFASDMGSMVSQENIGLIRDVPLEVTVELGRTTKSISDILDFAPGIIIELDKIAGEPIDVLVNGKFVARGEVVVIEESFGVRVTEIIK